MKPITLFTLILCLQLSVNAQLKTVAESPAFDEPVTGYARILHMQNGNTAFLHILNRSGIDVSLYDSSHHRFAEQHSRLSDLGQLWGAVINATFEVHNDIVLLISEYEKSTPVLYRAVIDGASGIVKENYKLFELDKQELTWGYHYPTVKSFYVRKDPNSDNYIVAVLHFDAYAHATDVTLVLYNSDHREQQRITYTPGDKFNFLSVIDVVFLDSGKVSLLAYGYNKKKNERLMKGTLLIAGMGKEMKEVKTDTSSLAKEELMEGGILRFNTISKKLMLVGVAGPEQFLVNIDPHTAKAEKQQSILPANVKSNHPFTGIPQDLFLKSDGGFYLVYEEMINRIFESATFSKNNFTILNNILVSDFDSNGELLSNQLIPNRQSMGDIWLPAFYHAAATYTAQELAGVNQYKTFSFINNNNNYYLLLNDVKRDTTSEPTLGGLRTANAWYFGADGKGRSALFKNRALGMVTVADTDPVRHLYTILKFSGKNTVQLAWLSYL